MIWLRVRLFVARYRDVLVWLAWLIVIALIAVSCRAHEAAAPCNRTDTTWSADCRLRIIIVSPCAGKITVDGSRKDCP